MGQIDRIVDVEISRQNASVSLATFDTMLIVAEFLKSTTSPAFDERTREYGSLAEMVADGFSTSSFAYKAAEAAFAQNPGPNTVKIGRKLTGADGTETWTAALTAIALEDNEWYGLIVEASSTADQQLVATWVESNKKLCVLASSDADIVDDTGDIAAWLETQNMYRTGVFYYDSADTPHVASAIMGAMFVKAPGSATWAYKELSGIPASVLTTAQISTALGKNANLVLSIGGRDITQMGTVGSGEFFDITHGIDWLEARIQERIFGVLVSNDKIPFTDAGIDVIVTEVKAALAEGVSNSLLASYTVSAPLAANVPSGDKASRNLPDVKFTATLAGAVHTTEIVGVVRV